MVAYGDGGTYPKNKTAVATAATMAMVAAPMVPIAFSTFQLRSIDHNDGDGGRKHSLPVQPRIRTSGVGGVGNGIRDGSFHFFVPSLRLPSPEKCRQQGVYACGRTVRAFLRCLRCLTVALTARTIESCWRVIIERGKCCRPIGFEQARFDVLLRPVGVDYFALVPGLGSSNC
ncbi:1-deoxy-D-xylulose 5-phosphate synthase [Anopheles sinensis]|uniref:1-deoxy-D-xylulose 5-phosphate synthase n=1 Tax=Anopheles sinensis TaxID=74873 RepID=A0A084VFF9_ANOSI|nr:1-deoxy-D-xylulose 5-phosphate synthase [Anopheles sinensis]